MPINGGVAPSSQDSHVSRSRATWARRRSTSNSSVVALPLVGRVGRDMACHRETMQVVRGDERQFGNVHIGCTPHKVEVNGACPVGGVHHRPLRDRVSGMEHGMDEDVKGQKDGRKHACKVARQKGLRRGAVDSVSPARRGKI